MDINWEKVDKIFRLIFPEFSNKVTWVVVGGGLGLTSSSFVQALINYFLEQQYNFQIFSSYDSLVGITLVAIGLTHNILLQREKTKIELNNSNELNQRATEHDIKLFEKLDSLMSEEILFNFLESTETSHAYYYSETRPLTNFKYEIEKVKSKFVLEPVAIQFEKLIPIANEFDSFLVRNFDGYGPGRRDDHYMCLHPQWNCDRGGRYEDHEAAEKYEQATTEMFSVFNKYRVAYTDFREAIKEQLYI